VEDYYDGMMGVEEEREAMRVRQNKI